MINIVLFGPPGAGKGTQSEKLIAKYKFVHLSTGDIFRRNIREATELGQLAKSFMDKGQLVPDSVTISMLESEVAKNKGAIGFIFDGFPRNSVQAEALDKFLSSIGTSITKMIALEVPEEELRIRLLSRGKISGRPDDVDPAIIQKRIDVYNNETAPVKNYYLSQQKYAGINGVGTVESIFGMICDIIDPLIKPETTKNKSTTAKPSTVKSKIAKAPQKAVETKTVKKTKAPAKVKKATKKTAVTKASKSKSKKTKTVSKIKKSGAKKKTTVKKVKTVAKKKTKVGVKRGRPAIKKRGRPALPKKRGRPEIKKRGRPSLPKKRGRPEIKKRGRPSLPKKRGRPEIKKRGRPAIPKKRGRPAIKKAVKKAVKKTVKKVAKKVVKKVQTLKQVQHDGSKKSKPVKKAKNKKVAVKAAKKKSRK